MEPGEVLEAVQRIRSWRQGDERAPHKPLLILLAVSEFVNHRQEELLFERLEYRLTRLLQEYGPPRRSYHPEYPFWRLQNDGIWTTNAPAWLQAKVDRKSSKEASKTELREERIWGGFRPEVLTAFEKYPELPFQVVDLILEENFPETYHEDLLTELGLDKHSQPGISRPKRTRDPKFRQEVLQAYGYACAVCHFQIMIDQTFIGLEAAHIQWHQAKGPDIVPNGIALCSIHHKLLDRGAFTISSERRIQVSSLAHGNQSFEQWLGKFHNQSLQEPAMAVFEPQAEYLYWHRKEVFKGQVRR